MAELVIIVKVKYLFMKNNDLFELSLSFYLNLSIHKNVLIFLTFSKLQNKQDTVTCKLFQKPIEYDMFIHEILGYYV